MPGILPYLKRSYSSENFNEHGPTDCTEQELWLYNLLSTSYRQDIKKKEFCKHGSLGAIEKSYVARFNQNSKTFVMPPLHPNDIRKIIDGIQLGLPFTDIDILDDERYGGTYKGYYDLLTSRLPQFWITLCNANFDSLNRHATTIFHIMNADRSYIHASFWIDSGDNLQWFSNLKSTFTNHETVKKKEASPSSGISLLPVVSLSDVNSGPLKKYKGQKEPAFLSQDPIEALNKLEGNFPGLTFENVRLFCNGGYTAHVVRTTPLIYISLGIQSEEDNNCSLFALNITSALLEMTLEDRFTQKLMDLEQRMEATGFKGPQEIEDLSFALTAELKKHLPQYYDTSLEGFPKRSQADLNAFHMQQRWEASGEELHGLLE
ncbi:MAG: hypothetical protein JSS34_02450 [Proteobacteria bacterium]|nr:hypothetical protein [Pseudomonadota bacterium]